MSRQSLNECRPSQVRFRVERPCTRCTTILVDQDTGEVDSRNWLTRVLAKAAGRYGAADPRYLPGATLPPRPRRKVVETAAQRQGNEVLSTGLCAAWCTLPGKDKTGVRFGLYITPLDDGVIALDDAVVVTARKAS